MATRRHSSAPVHRLSSRALLAALLLATLGAGCAATAPIRPALKSQAVPVSFAELEATPGQYVDNTVILGGQIIKTVPTPEGTVITVLQTKTENDERPGRPDTSEGRFMAVAKGLLDPQVYAPGRQVTVAGTVAGERVGKVGRVDYSYPVINAEQIYLWPIEPSGYYGWAAYEPFWGPFWGFDFDYDQGEEEGEEGNHDLD